MTASRTRNSFGIRIAAVLAVAATAFAALAWLHGAGTASAPEPAKLTGSFPGTTTGNLAPAIYLSGAATTVIRWPSAGQARADGSPYAGQPCSTVWFAPGAVTKQVIVASGSTRLCY